MGEADNHRPNYNSLKSYFWQWHASPMLLAFPPTIGPLLSLKNSINHISFLSLFPSKYCIALNSPMLCCLFHLVSITSTFISDTYLRLFLLFVASKFAITSGCALQEFAFSHTSARTRGNKVCLLFSFKGKFTAFVMNNAVALRKHVNTSSCWTEAWAKMWTEGLLQFSFPCSVYLPGIQHGLEVAVIGVMTGTPWVLHATRKESL